jgi:hypothetical protein
MGKRMNQQKKYGIYFEKKQAKTAPEKTLYNIYIGEQNTSTHQFRTNPKISETIAKIFKQHPELNNKKTIQTGYILYQTNPKKKLIITEEYYPISGITAKGYTTQKAGKTLPEEITKELTGKGIATFAEANIQQHLLQTHENHKIRSSYLMRCKRIKQIIKQRMNPYKKYPLNQSIQKLTKYMQKKTLKR